MKQIKKRTGKRKQFFFLVLVILFCVAANVYRLWGYDEDKIPGLFYTGFLFHGKEVIAGKSPDAGKTQAVHKEPAGTAETEAQGAEKKKTVEKKQPSDAEKDSRNGSDQSIRVVLKTQDFKSFYHSRIKLTATRTFSVSKGKNTKTYQANAKISFTVKDFSGGDEVCIRTEQGGKLKLLSLQRTGRYPVYRGRFWIRPAEEGLVLVNELSLEEYLYAVVPSEMSTTSPIEALKAQAVCARTFACNRLKASEYDKYGADLDDSESCQVYNNLPEDKKSREAVRQTQNIILKKEGKMVPVYYFSTSWGYTASGQEVWNTGEEISHLQSVSQVTEAGKEKFGKKYSDLSDETGFRTFLNDKAYTTYDSQSMWYRWKVLLRKSILENRFEIQLKKCYDSNANLILYQKKADGTFHKGPFRALGKVKKVFVAKRGKSGLVTELVIVGGQSTVKVCTQYNVRLVLAPLWEQILVGGGKKREPMSLLPSAAFYLEEQKIGKKNYLVISGGGFGHGAGMSQWGAKAQAESGWDYKRILQHYFTGVTL